MKERKGQTKKIEDRLARIEGQVRGIRKMIAEKKNCAKIIIQIGAVREAVSMLGVELLKDELLCHSKRKKLDQDILKSVFKFK